MTTEQLKSLSAAIDAHLRGEPVEWRYSDDSSWATLWGEQFGGPSFSTSQGGRTVEWRPKPKEPTPQFKRWAVLTATGAMNNLWDDRGLAEGNAKTIGGVVVELVEASRQSFVKVSNFYRDPCRFWVFISEGGVVTKCNSRKDAYEIMTHRKGRVAEMAEMYPKTVEYEL